MRILWFSNKLLTMQNSDTTGTWLDTMAYQLGKSGQVTLGNITNGNVKRIRYHEHRKVAQWIVPASNSTCYNGLPPANVIAEIIDAVNSFSPDIVHIWGTERYWGLLTCRGLIKVKALLEMQGIKFRITKVYNGNLKASQQIACIGLKEILRRTTLWQMKKRFSKWGVYEKEIIAGHHHIGVQTDWIESQVRTVNRRAAFYHNDLILRKCFHAKSPWQFSGNKRIFCLMSYAAPFKGLHIVVKALAILKLHFPDIKLEIGGGISNRGIRQDGYIAWLKRKIIKLGLNRNVRWLGPLDAEKIAACMQNASVMVIPSFIENCCTTMQEAMMIGIPVVVSYVGGLPSLATGGDSALYFPAGDEVYCAKQTERLLRNRDLASKISKRQRKIATIRNATNKIISRQLKIYEEVLSKKINTKHKILKN